MNMRKLTAIVGCMIAAMALLCVGAAAAETKPGVYTGSMVTTYYNPDTGNVDDGGTANAVLGEGMCRSATDKTAFVEVNQDGNVWVTVRLLLQSNCSNVALYTRSGYDSYTKVDHTIMMEDAANDSIDYRIKVSEPGQKLKCTMYVAPMGRDVLWYLYVDTSTLQEGGGDFTVSIDTDAIKAVAETPAKAEKPSEATPVETIPTTTEKAEAPETAAKAETPVDGEAELPMEGPTDEADASEPEDTLNGETDEEPDVEAPDTADSTETENADKQQPGISAGWIVAIVVVAAVAAVVLKKRKK